MTPPQQPDLSNSCQTGTLGSTLVARLVKQLEDLKTRLHLSSQTCQIVGRLKDQAPPQQPDLSNSCQTGTLGSTLVARLVKQLEDLKTRLHLSSQTCQIVGRLKDLNTRLHLSSQTCQIVVRLEHQAPPQQPDLSNSWKTGTLGSTLVARLVKQLLDWNTRLHLSSQTCQIVGRLKHQAPPQQPDLSNSCQTGTLGSTLVARLVKQLEDLARLVKQLNWNTRLHLSSQTCQIVGRLEHQAPPQQPDLSNSCQT